MSGEAWTPAETALVARLRADGLTYRALAEHLPGRSGAAVQMRLLRLQANPLSRRVPGRAGLLEALLAADGALVPKSAAIAASGAASRTVLCMHVLNLRSAGWDIDTVYGKGLRLNPAVRP